MEVPGSTASFPQTTAPGRSLGCAARAPLGVEADFVSELRLGGWLHTPSLLVLQGGQPMERTPRRAPEGSRWVISA